MIDLLQQVLDYQPDDGPAIKLHKLEAALASCNLTLPETVPLLAALLAVPLDDRYPPLTLAPERQRQRTLETVLTVLRGLATQQPGTADRGRFALGGPLDAGAARSTGGPGGDSAPLCAPHLAAGVSAPMAAIPPPDYPDPGPLAARAGGVAGHAGGWGQAPPPAVLRADSP